MQTFSQEHLNYLKHENNNKKIIIIIQISIILIFLILWELLSRFNIINSFLYSSPFNILKTIINNNFINHIFTTLYEIFISTFLSFIIGFIIATILWSNKTIRKIFDPYLTILNSLPKVALGPLIIIWIGANINSIIFMSLTISIFITIINLYNYFLNTNNDYIILLKSMNANKLKIYLKVIIPANLNNILNTLKINISMNLIGVIMGELLVSKKGLGYLIMYGSNVFNINLVITSIFIIGIISATFYYLINYLEKNIKYNI